MHACPSCRTALDASRPPPPYCPACGASSCLPARLASGAPPGFAGNPGESTEAPDLRHARRREFGRHGVGPTLSLVPAVGNRRRPRPRSGTISPARRASAWKTRATTSSISAAPPSASLELDSRRRSREQARGRAASGGSPCPATPGSTFLPRSIISPGRVGARSAQAPSARREPASTRRSIRSPTPSTFRLRLTPTSLSPPARLVSSGPPLASSLRRRARPSPPRPAAIITAATDRVPRPAVRPTPRCPHSRPICPFPSISICRPRPVWSQPDDGLDLPIPSRSAHARRRADGHPRGAGRHSGRPRRHPVQPRRHPVQPRRHPFQPRRHSLQPRRHSLQPRRHSLQPRRHPLQPRRHPVQPRRHSGQPRRHSGQPRRRSGQPRGPAEHGDTGCSRRSRGRQRGAHRDRRSSRGFGAADGQPHSGGPPRHSRSRPRVAKPSDAPRRPAVSRGHAHRRRRPVGRGSRSAPGVLYSGHPRPRRARAHGHPAAASPRSKPKGGDGKTRRQGPPTRR